MKKYFKGAVGKFIKYRLLVTIICMIAVLIIIPGILICSHNNQVPDNPIDGLNYKKSEVLISGEGYQIDKEQKKVHKKNLKKFEKLKKEEEKERNDSPNQNHINKKGEGESDKASEEGTGNGGKNSGSEGSLNDKDDDDDKDLPSESDLPTIVTNLKNGETYNGQYKSFWVTASDYKGNHISAFNLNVNGNGEKLTSTKDQNSKVTYKLELHDGINEVTIKATDKYGKSNQKTILFYGDTKAEAAKIGQITISVEASTLGLSNLIDPTYMTVYEGDQLPNVLTRLFEEKNFIPTIKGNATNGYYLAELAKKDITKGWKIPDDLLEKLDEEGLTETDYKNDSLGEGDFRRLSGWMYQVDGNFLDGMSTYYPNDGDVVRIRFTLHLGCDIGYTSGGDVWGNW